MKIKQTILASLLFFSLGIGACAMPKVDISVNGELVKTESQPIIKNDVVIAPARDVSKILGAEEILWDQENKIATFKNNDVTIEISIGKNDATVNGKSVKMQKSAEIIENKTYVPIRFLAENLGAKVSWEKKTYTVLIEKQGYISEENTASDYTKDELNWLAKIVHAEAGGEIMSGKIGVANVVLNRVEHKDFPNTIYGVIFDKKYGVQFTPVMNGAIYKEPSEESYQAAKRALLGENTVGNSLYFMNPLISTNFWIQKNRTFYKRIGGHEFYL